MMRRFEVLEARYALDGDALLHAGHEAIPNYVLEPDTVSVQDGNWFDPATWSDGVPDAFDDVRIDHHVSISRPPQRGDLTGDGAVDQHDFQTWLDGFRASSPDQGDVDRDGKVDFSDLQIIIDEWFGWSTPVRAEAEDVHVEGTLSFDPNVNTSLQVQTLTVAGSLEIGSQQQPVVAAAEVVFRDAPIDTDFDPQQLGHGLLVIGSGALTVYGRNNTPFVEVAEARAGSRTLVLEQEPSNWLPGDELFLPDSRLLERPAFSQAETVAIEHVDGRVVTLRAPLAFNHDGDGTNLPHAAHLSGNITFRSANPSGVRGHIMVSDRARIDVHDAVFRDLGRTTFDQLDNTHLGPDREVLYVGKNQVGRYSFHIHHLYGPEQADGPQFTFSDNVIRDGKKWGLAVHDSHYGLIENNVVVNMQGSGIVFEDGSEYGNTLRHNFVGLVPGSGQGVQGRANGEESRLAGTGAPDDPFRTIGDHGHEGAGIWARGVANNIVDNVVANAAFGSVLWSRFQPTEQIPAFPGADPNVDYQIVNRGLQHDHEFRGNEFYGMAVAASWQGIEQFGGTFVVEDGNVWNVWTNLDTSYSGTIRFDGGQYRGRFSFVQTGFTGHLEAVGGVQIIGFRTGLVLTHGGKVDDAYFACTQIDVLIEYEKTSTDQNQIVIDNARFSDDSSNIVYRLGDWFNKRSYTAPLDVLVHDYNGVEGDDFQIWMPQQQANYVMPITSNSNRGNRMSPEEGLTNQQLWNKYKLALGGKVLPKDAVSRAGIGGYVTAIPADLEGPQILDLKVTVSGSRAVLTFVTDEPCYSQVEYAAGDITVEGYAKFLSASKKLTTSHRVTITGLKANTDYQFLVRVIDVKGNLGGDTRLGGLKYVTREFDT